MENFKRNAQLKQKRKKQKQQFKQQQTFPKTHHIQISVTQPILIHQFSNKSETFNDNEEIRRSLSLKVTHLYTSYTQNVKQQQIQSFSSNYKEQDKASISGSQNNYTIQDDNVSKFISLCEKGDTDTMRQFLEQGRIDINTKLEDERNYLHVIIGSNKMILKGMLLLLQYGIDINKQNRMGRTPLISSTIKSNISICKTLIENKCEMNVQDMYGNTALHYSCIHGWYNIAKILLTYGADTEIVNKNQQKPEECCLNGQILKLFNTKSEYNRTIIQEHVIKNSRNDHVQRLIDQTQKDSTNQTESQSKSQESSSPGVKRQSKWKMKLHHFETILLKQQDEFDLIVQSFTKKVSLLEFKYLDLLGKGTFGQVYLVQHQKTKQLYAMKLLSKAQVRQNKLLPYVQMEKKILSMVKHPFIVGLHYAFQTADKLILIMTYCPGGDMLQLTKKMKKMDQQRIRRYTAEIILGLEALHKAEIIYRDLKPANVVLDRDGHACITDFGLAKESSIAHSFCGSLAYLAPQMIARRGHTRTIDWYLLGVLIYECYTGKPPFWDTTKDRLILNIKTGVYIPFEASQEMKDFVAKLLRADPSRRLGGKNDAQDVKQHPWFKGINWDDVANRKLQVPPIQVGKIDLVNSVRKTIFTEQDIEKSLTVDRILNWQYSIQ